MPTFNNYWGIAAHNIFDNLTNTEICHEQLFFEDETNENIGFGWFGKIIDSIVNIFGKDINDMIVGTGSKNNCQDWADNVRKEYKNLYKELPKEDRKQKKTRKL